MPLKPALSTVHPKAPAPREVRKVSCPQCGQAFEISMRAMSVRCPACTRPLEFKDLMLRQKLEGDVCTMGHVGVEGSGEMIGRLVCGQLTNEGRFEGRAIVFGTIQCLGKSLTTGEVSARSLRVTRGATLRARATIGPKPKVSPTARLLSYRPLKRISKRTFGANAAAALPGAGPGRESSPAASAPGYQQPIATFGSPVRAA